MRATRAERPCRHRDEKPLSRHRRRFAAGVRVRQLRLQRGRLRVHRVQVHDHAVVQVRPGQLLVLQRVFQLSEQLVQRMLLLRG